MHACKLARRGGGEGGGKIGLGSGFTDNLRSLVAVV